MMKKADSQKTIYRTITSAGNPGSPTPPAAGNSYGTIRRWSDPSSAERSNRYPVPTQEYRPR